MVTNLKNMNGIEKLGFDSWFKNKIDLSKADNFKIVRVISVSKNSFVISNGTNDIYAELTGKFLFNSECFSVFRGVILLVHIIYTRNVRE